MKTVKIIIMMLIILPLAGCLGNEPNNIAYVSAIGFDKTDSGDNYKITFQFARPSQISGGTSPEEGNESAEIIDNISVESPDIYSGIGLANHVVSKHFSLSHTKLAVFSEKLAREGIEDITKTLTRSNEIHPDLYYAVSIDEAEEYLKEVKPVIESDPVKYYRLVYEKNTSSGIPKNTTQDIYFKESNKGNGIVTALAGIKKDDASGSTEINEKGFGYKTKNYIAGEAALSEKNKAETIGGAVFKDNKMIDKIGGTETEIYNMLKGSLKDSYATLFSESAAEGSVSVKLSQRKKPSVKVNTQNMTADIKLYILAEVYSDLDDSSVKEGIEEINREAEAQINEKCKEFIDKMQNQYETDLIGISDRVKIKFLTYDDYDRYNMKEKIKDYKINVETDLKMVITDMFLIRTD